MPRAMNAVIPMEIIITPNTTYILFDSSTTHRSVPRKTAPSLEIRSIL